MKAIKHNEEYNFQDCAANGTYYSVPGSGSWLLRMKCPDCGREHAEFLDMWRGEFGRNPELNIFDSKSVTLLDPVSFDCGWNGRLVNGEWIKRELTEEDYKVINKIVDEMKVVEIGTNIKEDGTLRIFIREIEE